MGFTEGTTLWDDSGLPARQAAFHILNDIFYRRKNLDEAFAHSPTLETLQGRDKAFVRLLVSLVLKRAREMDSILEKLLRDPIAELKPPQLINIFRLGIAQYIYLKTPAHAAVNTSVELAEAEKIVHHKSLVNAVMRRLTREEITPPDAREAGKMNTPAWLWNAWMADYGVETSLDIAAANLDEGAIDFTVKENPEEWAQKLEAVQLPTGSLRREGGGFIPDLPGFVEGAWWIQNAAAAMPAKLFGDLKGKTVIDLCAAPGGKTAQLAAMGANVIALDRSAERVRRLTENMERLNLKV
ncbi:MAG: transporter, partial [Alphaproteobacteria bacterium]|nr:transporter [Alphaproteobacteria bacterium]